MNKEYILNRIKPYLNSKSMLGEEDFNRLFYMLNKQRQYEIINILIESDIEIDYEETSINTTKVALQTKCTSTYAAKIDKLTNEQLCVIYQQGDKTALEALVKKNTKLVWSRVIKYGRKYNHKLDEEDLAQYGFMGLLKAADKFDIKQEARFTTYAVWWIDQHILRSIVDYGFTVRLPVHYFDQVMRLLGIMIGNPERSKQEVIELAKDKGINRDKFEEYLFMIESIMSLASLNSFVNEDEESELVDFVIEDKYLNVEEQVEYNLLKEYVNLALSNLNDREKDVLELRFGLKDGVERTLEQVGIKYGVTRERIRQIEAKALRKLRHPSRSKILKDFA